MTLRQPRWPLRRVQVSGPSMVPALRDGDVLLVWLGSVAPSPGRVVVVALPDRPLAVKRVRRHGPEGVWLEGDNPPGSTDSRQLGWLPTSSLRGRVLLRVSPRPGRVPGTAAD